MSRLTVGLALCFGAFADAATQLTSHPAGRVTWSGDEVQDDGEGK